jgi:hypothetical protein
MRLNTSSLISKVKIYQLGSVHLFFNTVFKVDKNASTHGIRRETNATQISTGKIENESHK